MYGGISERINRDHISCLNMFGFKKDEPVNRSAMTKSWYKANVSVFAFFGGRLGTDKTDEPQRTVVLIRTQHATAPQVQLNTDENLSNTLTGTHF